MSCEEVLRKVEVLVVRKNFAIVAAGKSTEGFLGGVNGNTSYPAIAECELDDSKMVAAEAPVEVVDRGGDPMLRA